jgi:hypothetical protein
VRPDNIKVKSHDINANLNLISENLVAYLNILNRNAFNTFKVVKKEMQRLDARLNIVVQNISDIKKYHKDLEYRFHKLEIKSRNFELTKTHQEPFTKTKDYLGPAILAALATAKLLQQKKPDPEKPKPVEEPKKPEAVKKEEVFPVNEKDIPIRQTSINLEAEQVINIIAANELCYESKKIVLDSPEIVFDSPNIQLIGAVGTELKLSSEQFDDILNAARGIKKPIAPAPITPPSARITTDALTQLGTKTVGKNVYTFAEARRNPTILRQFGLTPQFLEPSIPGTVLYGKS